ncbi:MAG: hypothetical protein NTZ61_12045 [Proteobacteria bacterium]|nr:hypothetical protein [Pseudomonadota bacterium]
MRDADPATAVHRDVRSHRAGDAIELAAVPGLQVAVAELIPQRRCAARTRFTLASSPSFRI